MHQNYINGRFVAAGQADEIAVINPSNRQTISSIPDTPAAQVEEAIAAARAAQRAWARRPAIERAGYLRKIATGIRARAEEIARTLSEEQGKVLPLARVEAQFTADYLDYMAEWARRIEGEIIPSDRPGETIMLMRQAIGVVGGILPWNFPFFLIARKMGPALLTGNTIVIKPSEETPNNAAIFADILSQVDLPAGVYNQVYGRGGNAGRVLASHAGVDMISFTGSVDTGSAIMAAAAPNITKLNLELGGKAPAIVLEDADLDLAARAIAASRVINTGQVCNCAERVYVQRSVAEAFTEKLVAQVAAARWGNPLQDETLDMGPLINQAGRDKVAAMLQRAVDAGAQVATGGQADDRDGGFFFQPTVLTHCQHDWEIMQKEIFGPVVPVAVVDSLDEAIDKANDTTYGLTSSIYTRSLDAALRASTELEFGETYVNRENFEAMQGFHAGVKKSGIGGADGKHGVYEYTQTHTVYIQRQS
ncbi:aldehyde dehydrogenase [Allofranklinella schreckenbergeri]|uniref:Aldehyde dehydrogenase n=1 Tax=Allofranklinella schreckenbergeri TaxID=1076744 RepID=A0A3M6Q9N1_9BURK|nr:aldehyde dehydrogenase [Allofranklinella schreckenbergeri]RMW99646.1 aldehyde dehydrogenase [Allofranklinella schreckenbergeri]